ARHGARLCRRAAAGACRMKRSRTATRRTVSGALAILRAYMQVWAAYRANIAIWSTTSVLQVVIYLSVWRAVAVATGGSTGGYTPEQFAGYFLILMLVREMTFTWVAWEFGSMVEDGSISKYLLQPFHFVITAYSGFTAYRIASLVFIVPTAAV